jgi:hypothetical protein
VASPHSEEKEKPFVSFAQIKEDTYKSIFEAIPIAPGGASGKSVAELESFQWRKDGNGQYIVCLPKNLEKFAENWPVRCAVAACAVLNAKVQASSRDLAEFTNVEHKEEYLHGIAAALKTFAEQKTIPADSSTGSYHQGYRWVATRNLVRAPNSGLYKLSYTNPMIAITGRQTWNANAPNYQKILV